MGILFTPIAMVIAQTILIVPIIAALRARPWKISGEYRDELTAMESADRAHDDPVMGRALQPAHRVAGGFRRAAAEVGAS